MAIEMEPKALPWKKSRFTTRLIFSLEQAGRKLEFSFLLRPRAFVCFSSIRLTGQLLLSLCILERNQSVESEQICIFDNGKRSDLTYVYFVLPSRRRSMLEILCETKGQGGIMLVIVTISASCLQGQCQWGSRVEKFPSSYTSNINNERQRTFGMDL